jgi:hypothetical protein
MRLPTGLGAVAAAWAALSPIGSVRAEAPASTVIAAPVEQARIDAAVRRGVAWLRGEQDASGAFGAQAGESALALLALRHSGVREDDPACRRAAASLLRDLPDGTSYGASLGVVALLAQEGAKCREKAKALVDDLVRAQCDNGQWSYAARRSTRATSGDNSNTQFAVFALAAARARGIDVPRGPFEKCLAFLRATRNADGGWGYAAKQRSGSYASMAAGGAMCAGLCLEAPSPGDVRLADHADVAGALRWLGERFDPAVNAGAAEAFGPKKGRRGDEFWRHYWLWSLERACSVTATARLGEHDWYDEGARFLLERQRADGSWLGPERAVVATSFALLFFARGTLRVVTPRGDAAVVTPR